MKLPWLANKIRRLADRIDYAGAPKAMGHSFTFERGKGIEFNEDGRGCPLWYLGDTDYTRAHTEAKHGPTRHPRTTNRATVDSERTTVATQHK